ncbi:MAG: tetratricopeptide repeat protein, partial [Bacteroidia bacterium]|nr:tetratricopeptide repeat protein [Bacteroidia bacterium]
LTLYPPKPAPSQWEMARDSEVYPQFGAHAGASGSWVEEYQNRDWDQTVASLQPQVDAFLAQHAQDNEPVSYQEARMLLGLGSALLKQNPQNPFAAKPYLLAAQSQQTESSVAAEATYFLGLMYLLAGDLPTAEQTWQSLLVEPSPVQDRYVQEIKRLLSAS